MTANLLIASGSALVLLFRNIPAEPFVRPIVGLLMLTLAVGAVLNTMRRRPRPLVWFAWGGILFLILFSVLVPLLTDISRRHVQGPATAPHDNPIQMESAVRFLRQGKNPYTESYVNTPLALWGEGRVYGIPNPALSHLIMLPGHVLLSTAASFLFEGVFGFYDERMLYLLVYLVLVALATRLGRTSQERLRSVTLIGLNPLAVPYLIEGRNDVLLLTALLAAFLALDGRRWTLAGALFAFACTIKMFAWFFAPFFILVFIAKNPATEWRRQLRACIPPLAIAATFFAAVMLPFFLWNPAAFLDDTIRYANGTLPTSYPINGGGFSMDLLGSGLITNRQASFPFLIWQLLATVPIFVYALVRLATRPQTSLLIAAGTVVLFVWLYFSRFFHDNYSVLLIVLGVIALGFFWRERGVRPTERGRDTSPNA